MTATRGYIIKSDEVQVTGSVLLEIDAPDATAPCADRHAGRPAQVKVVEQHDDRAILEVTCACGQSIRIRCDYANAVSMSS